MEIPRETRLIKFPSDTINNYITAENRRVYP